MSVAEVGNSPVEGRFVLRARRFDALVTQGAVGDHDDDASPLPGDRGTSSNVYRST
jgi:hypothetical protein